jgi:hypothetical protein
MTIMARITRMKMMMIIMIIYDEDEDVMFDEDVMLKHLFDFYTYM